MRPLARWGSLPLLATPIGTWALGLGEIELHSALNQPLDAEIKLVSATAQELASLDVSLAPLESFQRSGLERPAFLGSLNFEVGRNAAGENVVRVSSPQAIAEPFVTMLVEAQWGRGRLMREYTVFLDPPVLLPSSASPEPVTPAESRAPEPRTPGGTISRAQPEPAPARPQPAAAPAPAGSVAAGSDGSTFGPVQNGETLWGIATNYRPAGVSINQAMVAIYRANPDAFGGNMNHLRRGAILRIPPAGDMNALPSADANVEVRRQNDAWRPGADLSPASEQRLVLVPPSEAMPAATGGAGQAGAAANGEAEALRSQLQDLEAQLAESERLLELRNSELAELQNQLADDNVEAELAAVVEPPPAATDPGVELASEELFADEGADEAALDEAMPGEDVVPVGAEAPIEAPVEPETPVQSEAPVAPETPAPSRLPAVSTTEVADAPSLVDRILGILTSTIGLIGGGVLLILLGALMFLRRRHDEVEDATGQWEALEADLDDDDEAIAATARMRAQSAGTEDDIVVEESRARRDTALPPVDDDAAAASGTFSGVFDAPDTDDDDASLLGIDDDEAAATADGTMSSQTLSSQTVINLDQADPIAEADFHMAYGLYDQAADLVLKALEADPDNLAYRLKLLEVYFVWGNKDAFLEAASALKRDLGDDAAGEWAKVVIMGKQICPDESLFADAQAAAGNVDLDLEAGDSPGLDLAFDGDDGSPVDLDFGADDAALDLSVEDTVETDMSAAAPPSSSSSTDYEDMLDIGERTQAGLEAALFEIDAEAEKTSPGGITDFDDDDESLAATQESPTIETPSTDFELSPDTFDPTLESPTVEAEGPDLDASPTVATVSADAATVESPALSDGEAPTVETPTIETPAAFQDDERPVSSEMTAELDLGDLGLDVSDIEDLGADLGELPQAEDADSDTREQPGIEEADDELLSATGVTHVLTQEDVEANDLADLTGSGLEALDTAVLDDSEETMMAPAFADGDPTHADTEVITRPEADAFAGSDDDDDALDLKLDDFSEALEGGDTVEQPLAASFDDSLFGDDSVGTPIDLDVGNAPLTDDDPTGTEANGPLDAQTMTEVGTKLDLARAYIDMGDPEGAKSILEEVLTEGDSGQRQEAQSLIDALPA